MNQTLADDWVYHAKEGDTLWDLCLQYTNKRGCWIELQRYNNISDDKVILPGTEIKIPTRWMRFPPVVGSVLSVHGEVFYQINNTSESKTLVQGQTVHLGAVIFSTEGSARISLYPHSEILLSPQSHIELKNFTDPLEQERTLELYMKKGGLEATIDPNTGTHFQIETPAAIAAVRGTRYRTTTSGENSESTRTEVLAGSVEVHNQGSILLTSGFGISSSSNGPMGEPKALLPPPSIIKGHMNRPLPVVLEWSLTGEEVAWELVLFGAEDESAIIDTAETTEPHFEYTDLQTGCYKLSLRAIDQERFHSLEEQSSICIIPELLAVENLTINNNTADDSWTAHWTPAENAKRYTIQLASDSSFQEIIATQELAELQARINPPPSDFFIRVIAQDQYGNHSPASEPVEGHHSEDSLIPAAFLMYAAFVFML